VSAIGADFVSGTGAEGAEKRRDVEGGECRDVHYPTDYGV